MPYDPLKPWEYNYLTNCGYTIPEQLNLDDPYLGFTGELRQRLKQLRIGQMYGVRFNPFTKGNTTND